MQSELLEGSVVSVLADRRIITHRGEFIDALHLPRDGHVLARAGHGAFGCVLDGAVEHHSYATLCEYGLTDEFDNPAG